MKLSDTMSSHILNHIYSANMKQFRFISFLLEINPYYTAEQS